MAALEAVPEPSPRKEKKKRRKQPTPRKRDNIYHYTSGSEDSGNDVQVANRTINAALATHGADNNGADNNGADNNGGQQEEMIVAHLCELQNVEYIAPGNYTYVDGDYTYVPANDGTDFLNLPVPANDCLNLPVPANDGTNHTPPVPVPANDGTNYTPPVPLRSNSMPTLPVQVLPAFENDSPVPSTSTGTTDANRTDDKGVTHW